MNHQDPSDYFKSLAKIEMGFRYNLLKIYFVSNMSKKYSNNNSERVVFLYEFQDDHKERYVKIITMVSKLNKGYVKDFLAPFIKD